jgi:WD40 repeat protein
MAAPAAPAGYDLVREIGSGGFGTVWLARSQTGIWRAVKIVASPSPADREVFRRELSGITRFQAATLGQPTQLAILHVEADDAQGLLRYVMELADDASGAAAFDPASYVPLTLKELRARRGRLPVAEVARIGMHVARGLAFLHSKGLLHRDVKPSNIILVGGVPKLSDLGLVTSSETAMTRIGTQGYVAPEGPGTALADLYSLGLVLFELATHQSTSQFPCLPKDLPSWPDARDFSALNDILLRACAREPSARHASADALADDLAAFLSGRSLTAMDAARRRWKRRGLAAMGALAVSAVASGLALREARVARDREALAATRRQFAVNTAFQFLQSGNPAAALAQWRSVPGLADAALPASFLRGQIDGDPSVLLAQAVQPWTSGHASLASGSWIAAAPDGRVAWGSLQSNQWAWVPGLHVTKVGPWRPGGDEAWVSLSNQWHALRLADARLGPPVLSGEPEAAAPDGSGLVASDPAATHVVLRLWRDSPPAPPDVTLPVPRPQLLWAALSPGSETLAVAWFELTNGLRRRRLGLWSLTPPRPLGVKAVEGWIWGLHATQAGRALYVADGRLAAWHAPSDGPPVASDPTDEWIRSSALAPDGTTWVAGTENGRVRWHDVAPGASAAQDRRGHVGPVRAVAWLGGDAPVVSFGDDGSIRRWPATGTERSWEGGWTGEFGDAIPGPGGTTILATRSEAAVAVLDARTTAVVGEVTGSFQPLEPAADGTGAWYLGPGLTLQRRSWPGHAIEWQSPPLTTTPPTYVMRAPGHVLVGAEDGLGAGWAVVARLDTNGSPRRISLRVPPVALALDPLGRLVGCSFPDGSVEVVDVATGAVAWNLSEATSGLAKATVLKWDPTGSRIAVGRSDGSLALHVAPPQGTGADAGTPRLLATVRAHAGHVVGVAWEASGAGLVTIADDGFLRFWQGDDLQPSGSWKADPDGLASVSMDPGSRQLITLGVTGRVRRWPMNPGRP